MITMKKSNDVIYIAVISCAALVLAFLSITVQLVDRIYLSLGPIVSDRTLDFFFNFAFLLLAGLIFFFYRKWRIAEAARQDLDDIVTSISPDVLIVIGQDRQIRLCNRSVTRMFGMEPHEVIGRKTDYLYKDRRTVDPRGREIYEVLDREGFHVGHATGMRKDSSEMPIEIITAVLKGQRGAVLLLRDITERIKAEQMVRKVRDFYRTLFDEFPIPIRF